MATAALTEEIASNLEEVAQATRTIDTRAIGFFSGGLTLGFAIGFLFGYRFNREKIKAEAFAESAAEVEKIREHYQQKSVAAQPKPTVEEIIEERGYSVQAEPEMPVRPLKPPVVVAPARSIHPKSKMDGWDYDFELSQRVTGKPYVIHEDERGEEPGYNSVAYTYYELDGVLTDEDDEPVPHGAEIVGLDNLKFGHGAGDEDVVFVRNERLEIEMEIERRRESYEREVLGLEQEPESESESEQEPELEHSDSRYPQRSRRRKRRR